MTQRITAAFFTLALLASAGLLSLATATSAKASVNHEPLRGAWTNTVTCLTPAARALIDSIEAKFGKMDIISTCRPGARVAGTGGISRHSSGNAIDFIAGDRKAAVLAWLIATHSNGGTMTYSNSPHIHVDIGPHWVQLAGGRAFTPGEGTQSAQVRYTHKQPRHPQQLALNQGHRHHKKAGIQVVQKRHKITSYAKYNG